jgi:high affinity Mn2+ porin
LGAIVRALSLGCVLALALLACDRARGAELALPAKAVARADTFDWTGFYLGGHVGYAWGRSDWAARATGVAQSPLAGALNLYQPPDAWTGTGSYFGGLQAGYNLMLPSRLVVGAEVDVLFPNSIVGDQRVTTASVGPVVYDERVLIGGTVRGRIGYAFGNWLPYATGGFAWTFDRPAFSELDAARSERTLEGATLDRQLLWRYGWTIGAGVEFPFAPNWTARAEYLFTDYSNRGTAFPAVGQRVDSNLAASQLRLGLNYHLPGDGKGWDALTAQSIPPNLDNVAIHAQTTFIGQYAAPFRSPYQGANSLTPNAGREGWDVTLYAGLRPWRGAEIWINPEIDQGFALNDFHGVAGFVNYDPSKGSSYPFTRIHRYFFRQTVDLGGATQKVAADLNQFATTQTADRLVITVGKFSVGDVFDLNKYAQDARSDFMNLAMVSTGTFDYAADAFGYTYGAAAEWYQGPWTLRGGYFDMSRVSAGVELDSEFREFQWVGEIERRYDLWGQPGKILFTGFLSRARMGRYNDAVSLSQLTGRPADIAAVRRSTSRSGISMSFEQQVAPDLGFFARAGIADGNVQDYEITDIDRTVVVGLSQSGKSWGRPNDTFGLAAAVNNISSAHQAFFNAGGLGIVIGDGMLPHPGLEQIIETYYRYNLTSLWDVTLDYQFVNNPAYNRDRGPVSVIALRLHADF